MKRIIGIATVLALLAAASPASSEETGPTKTLTLDNGFRFVLSEKHGLPLFNMVVAVNVGSKDETDETSGLIHLLEHCILFCGTESRSGPDISMDIRRHGAYFNAHTGQDISLFAISLPAEHADFALRNQNEILFGMEVSQEDLDTEKSAILEEMNQLEDDPLTFGLDLVFRHLFKGHAYGRSVYGLREVIEKATADQLRSFHRRFFVPGNCAAALVGDFRIPEMEKKIRTVFGSLEGVEPPGPSYPMARVLKQKEEIRMEKDIQQAYLFIGHVGPDYNSPDQYAMDVLSHIMGRGISPMLNTALRSRRNLVQTVNMLYFGHRFGGATVVTMALDPKNVAAAVREASSFLKRSSRENFSKDDYYGDQGFYALDLLESAKNQIRFSVEKSLESGLNLAMSFARYLLLSDRPGEVRYLEMIDSLRSTDLRKAASTYFGKGEPVIVILLPGKDGPGVPD